MAPISYGGTNGISYSFTIEGADDKLRRIGGAQFPMTGTLAAGESFVRRVRYDAFAPSADSDPLYSNVPGAGFVARWYLQPDYVSFSGIKV